MLGRVVRQPYEIMITPSSNQPATYAEYVTDIHSKMPKAHGVVARHHLAQTSTRQNDFVMQNRQCTHVSQGTWYEYYMNRDQRASVQNWK